MDVISYAKAVAAELNSLRKVHVNPYFRKYTPTYRDTFGDLTRWVVQGSSGTTEEDTEHYMVAGIDKREDGSWVHTNAKAIKFTKTVTTTTDARMQVELNPYLDLSGNHAVLRYYVHPGEGLNSPANLEFVRLRLWDANLKQAFWTDTGNNGFQAGWRTTPFRCGASAFAVIDEGFDFTQIRRIDIGVRTFISSPDATPSITLDALDFFPKLQPPIPYVLTLDGGYKIQKEILAYCAARGIRAHLYVTYDDVGKAGRMTLDDLKQAQRMGHFIDCHERNGPPTGFYTLTQQQKVQSVVESLRWRAKNGFLEGQGFAPLRTEWYPDLDIYDLLDPWLEHIRVGGTRWLVPYDLRILGIGYDTNTLVSVADEATKRQAAVDAGTIYVGLVHGLTYDIKVPEVKQIIDAGLSDPNVRFVTIPELLNTNWYEPH